MDVEICVDTLESVASAAQFPIARIELCAALSVGGLTPSYGFIQKAQALSTVPLYVMIRPRAGDFIYSEPEIALMQADIKIAKQLGVAGIVFGVLNKQADIDIEACRRLLDSAQGLDVTFHRAFDVCRDAEQALETLIALGIRRVLTSGQSKTAIQGVTQLKRLVVVAKQRIAIMAGAGITQHNACTVAQSGVDALHLSAKTYRDSVMTHTTAATMGEQAQDYRLQVTDVEEIRAVLSSLNLTR